MTEIEELHAETTPDDPRVVALMARIDGIEASINRPLTKCPP